MSVFFNDTFTEASTTLLTAHTSNSGHTWSGFAGGLSPAPSVYTTLGGVVGAGASSASVWRPSIISPTVDVSVSQLWRVDSISAGIVFGAAARLNAAGDAGYAAVYQKSITAWIIVRIGASLATTTLATSSTVTYANGATPSIEFIVTGSGATVTLELKVGGSTLLTTTDTSGSRITTAGYTGFWLHSGAAQGFFLNSMSSDDLASSAATAVTMTGPTSGTVGSPSTNFTVGANGTITGTVVVTPSDGGAGGTFTPTTVSISSGSPTGTFTYTAASTGAKTISVTNDGSLTNPSNITYTASSAAATAVTLTGPTTSTVGSPSTNFTAGANGAITGTVVVTPSDGGGGGTFTPTTVSISAGTPTATFTYTAGSTGSKTISVTNNGSLTNPSNITLTASSAAATALSLTGPTGGVSGVASTNFTVTANGALSGSITVTPSDSSGGGAFTPTTVALSSGVLSGTFTYTPASTGAKSISITNTGSLTNPSALTYTSTAASAEAPFPPTLKDRVKDTSTTASGTSITLNAAPPTGYQAFATAFAVGTKAIPVLCEDTAGNWMQAFCTLTNSTTLTVESISSSSAAGAAPTFSGGTKTVYCVMPAKLAFKARSIDLSDYAIYPDFTTDSTAGIQQAILDAYDRRIEKIIAPPGHFKIAGARVGSGNCQLYLPQTREALPNRSIWIDGVCPPNFQNQGLWEVVPSNNGTLFESTIAGGGTRPSVFGAEQGNAGDARVWNYTNFLMTNCGIRTKANNAGASTMCAINMEFVSQIPLLDNLMIGVNTPLQTMTNPTGGNSIGINLPPVNNHAWINIGKVYISGYETGINATEHTYIEHALLLGCVNGIALQAANHASHFNMVTMEHVKHNIVVNGNHPLSIGMYETEHNGSISWATHTQDILVNSGSRKIAILRASVVIPGTGYVEGSNFLSNDPTIYKIVAGTGAN